MIVKLKILLVVSLIIGYFATSFFGLAFIAGCIIGDLIGDSWFETQ